MTINERVKLFAKSKGLKVKQFEDICGMSNGYVASMRKGMGLEKLQNVLAAFPDLNRDWLLYEEGDMLKGSGQHIIVEGTLSRNQQVNFNSNNNNKNYNEKLSINKALDEIAELHKVLAETIASHKEQTDKLLAIIEKLAAK